MSSTATRRADRRAETVAEIKAAAWAEMRESGVSDCSLRAVARRIGISPSALYRYFSSRDDLLTALIVDAFNDLADTLSSTYRTHRGTGSDERGEVFVAVAGAYRCWAVTDPLRYRLIFSSPVGGYVGNERTTAAEQRSTQMLLDIMADLVAADALDAERLTPSMSVDSTRRFEHWAGVLPHGLPPVALAAALDCYASLHGAIELEVNRHLPPPLRHSEDVFGDTMRRVVASVLRRR